MKFLADMGISPKTVQWLIGQGYDTIHLLDEGLEKLPDEKILEKARLEGRVILTVDLDFGTLLAIAKTHFPSVVIFRLGNASRDVIEARLIV
jgi:predicted nuclease of predicted toxin-antitoxin system